MRRGLLDAAQPLRLLRDCCHTLATLQAASRQSPNQSRSKANSTTSACSFHTDLLYPAAPAGAASRSCAAAAAVTPGKKYRALRCCATRTDENQLPNAEDDSSPAAKLCKGLHLQLNSIPTSEASPSPQPQDLQQGMGDMASCQVGGDEATRTGLVSDNPLLPVFEQPKTVGANGVPRAVDAHPKATPAAGASSALQAESRLPSARSPILMSRPAAPRRRHSNLQRWHVGKTRQKIWPAAPPHRVLTARACCWPLHSHSAHFNLDPPSHVSSRLVEFVLVGNKPPPGKSWQRAYLARKGARVGPPRSRVP